MARVENGASITLASGAALQDVQVTAAFNGKEGVSAKAGAAGGYAIVPVLALDVSGVCVEALLGSALTQGVLPLQGEARLSAGNTMDRTLLADAAATGSSVAVGAAIGVSVVNDSAAATLARSVLAKNVLVNASSQSDLAMTVKAGANGSEPSEDKDASAGTGGLSRPGVQWRCSLAFGS
jgi:hypothetical protein